MRYCYLIIVRKYFMILYDKNWLLFEIYFAILRVNNSFFRLVCRSYLFSGSSEETSKFKNWDHISFLFFLLFSFSIQLYYIQLYYFFYLLYLFFFYYNSLTVFSVTYRIYRQRLIEKKLEHTVKACFLTLIFNFLHISIVSNFGIRVLKVSIVLNLNFIKIGLVDRYR